MFIYFFSDLITLISFIWLFCSARMTGRKCTLCLQFIISWYQTFVTRCQTPTYARTIIHCCVCLCLFLLQVRIKTAKRRVVMASLYLGTGQLEQELVRNVLFVRSRFFFFGGGGGGHLRFFNFSQVRTMPAKHGRVPNSWSEMPENCESVLSSRRTTVWFVQNESARQASYKE